MLLWNRESQNKHNETIDGNENDFVFHVFKQFFVLILDLLTWANFALFSTIFMFASENTFIAKITMENVRAKETTDRMHCGMLNVHLCAFIVDISNGITKENSTGLRFY